ncbi:hypothetical protein CJD36_019230 [Flavipsychrobacter stenotrophus]|uniref:Uncharacterized protein n=2 Tax=Flavipsychrobacter stenotrophus TaxID=2077091 RepID=A0A2S7SR49_9BACT|nr:hypothetical protein CJD36_019230 [Flavipsychrobacter stenotrophus]
MSFEEEILSIVGRMNSEWFSAMSKMFKSEVGYNPKSKRLVRVITGQVNGYDPDSRKDNTDPKNVNVSLVEYCWEYDFEKLRYEGDNLPIEGRAVCRLLDSIITLSFQDLENPTDARKRDLVAFAFSIVKSGLIELEKNAAKKQYLLVLGYFKRKFTRHINFKYDKYKQTAIRVQKVSDAMSRANQIKINGAKKAANIDKKMSAKFNAPHNLDNLEDVFIPRAIPTFLEVEEGLLDEGVIDINHKFLDKKGNKLKLIVLIHVLSEHGYFKSQFHNRSTLNNFPLYRRFIEKRYDTTLAASVKKFILTKHDKRFINYKIAVPKLNGKD